MFRFTIRDMLWLTVYSRAGGEAVALAASLYGAHALVLKNNKGEKRLQRERNIKTQLPLCS